MGEKYSVLGFERQYCIAVITIGSGSSLPGFKSQLYSVMLRKVLNSQCWFYLKNECHNLQFSSAAQSCPLLCNPMDYSTPGFPVHHQLPELAQTHVHRVGDTIQPSHPLLPLLLLPSIFPIMSQFFHHIRWPKDMNFSFSISPSNEYSGLISFRIDWFDLLAVRGTLKSPSVQKHGFFGAQPSLWSNSHILTWLLEKP